jgi:hypothetical protein
MTDQHQADPLTEWNRLNRENAEQGFASALFKSMAHTNPAVDKFSLWLLAGSGASGALLISQIEAVLPHLTAGGFKLCLLFLVISAVFGFIAKYKSLRCQIQTEMESKLSELLVPIFDKHEEDEERIQEYAKQRGIALETEINFSNVVAEVAKPFPFWVKWLILRQAKKNEGNRQVGYHIAVKAYFGQLRYTFWQAVAFLAFLCAGAWFARAI